MQNFALLKALGETRTPVLLKRSMMGTIEELLLSAEYIMKGGNPHVILCERGIRTFETETRNTLDIGAVPAIKRLSHLPIIVDPSHAMGNWHYVPALQWRRWPRGRMASSSRSTPTRRRLGRTESRA